MKSLIAIVFTLICKPGVISSEGNRMVIMDAVDKCEYYYFTVELTDGLYVYHAPCADSAWFVVSQDELILSDYTEDQLEILK